LPRAERLDAEQKLQSRQSAPIGSTKSNMTATKLSSAGMVPSYGSTAAMQMTGPLDSVRLRTVQDQAKSFTIGEAVVLGPDGLSRSRS
jgi:hypothetical protein